MISRFPPLKKTILCIDDDEAILRYEKMLLERSGYAVLTAVSAQQGLRLVTMCKCDVVLLDYEMPVMNGNELAFEIRRIRPELMIILLSGTEVPTHAMAFVDAFVPKLEANRRLLPMIAEICSRPTYTHRQKAGLPHALEAERPNYSGSLAARVPWGCTQT